jgi:hypothetical protein
MNNKKVEFFAKWLSAIKNIIIIILMAALLTAFVVGGVGFFKFMNETDKKYNNEGWNQSSSNRLTLAKGTWILEEDSNAGMVTAVRRAAIFYNSYEHSEQDWYQYYITNHHLKANAKLSDSQFLYLIGEKEKDTLSYEILSDGRNGTLSLLHLDSGKINVYKKH